MPSSLRWSKPLTSGLSGRRAAHHAPLWRNVELPGGERARDLVASLPDDVRAHLTELTNAGKRLGGLWSAAGTLAAGTRRR